MFSAGYASLMSMTQGYGKLRRHTDFGRQRALRDTFRNGSGVAFSRLKSFTFLRVGDVRIRALIWDVWGVLVGVDV